MSSLLVRRASRHEVSDIEQLIVAAFTPFRGEVAATNLLEAYIDNSRNIAARWDEAEVLVVEVNGRIGGTVTWYADASREGLNLPRGWAGFRTLAVHPALRGLGLGRRLVSECINRGRLNATETMAIHTAAFMRSACWIYETLGFRRYPDFDLWASEVFGCDPILGDISVIAYRLDLVKPFT